MAGTILTAGSRCRRWPRGDELKKESARVKEIVPPQAMDIETLKDLSRKAW